MSVLNEELASQGSRFTSTLPFLHMGEEPYFNIASEFLARRSSCFEAGVSARLLEQHYGLTGEINLLSSETERTEEIRLPDGRRLILKTSSHPEAVNSFRFQATALLGLEGAEAFSAPRIIRSVNGSHVVEEAGLCAYLQTRLEGKPLHATAPSADLLFRAGSSLAALDKALGHLRLPAADRPILWHVGCWPRLMKFHHYVPQGTVADNVYKAMDGYVTSIQPNLSELEWQVTHNDPSPFNMLSTETGVAFIDFGDGCWNPRIQDLAIAASHMVTDCTLPLGGAEHLIAGYASRLPLSPFEASVLVGLMRARQSALILVNYWRSQLFPEQATYIKKNVARAEKGLTILQRLCAPDGEMAVLRANKLS